MKDLEIIGTDKDRGNAAKAHSVGALDRTCDNLRESVEGAMIVVISTPVSAMKDVMQTIGPGLEEGCLVTDTGSVKAAVMNWAEEHLPKHTTFVGGHPIVFGEGSGPDAADSDLFAGRPYYVIPGARAHQDGIRVLLELVKSVKAVERFIDAEEHDSFVAAVNDLPMLLSAALVGCTSKSQSWDDIALLASTHFGEIAHLIGDDNRSAREAFFFNKAGTVAWIDAFIRELYLIRQTLSSDDEDTVKNIESMFVEVAAARQKWLSGAVMSETLATLEQAKAPPKSGGMFDIFTGDGEARSRAFGWGTPRRTGEHKN